MPANAPRQVTVKLNELLKVPSLDAGPTIGTPISSKEAEFEVGAAQMIIETRYIEHLMDT